MTLSSPYWAARSARRSLYAVTDQRAIIWEAKALNGVTICGDGPERLASMALREKDQGRGDLIFERSSYKDSDGDTQTREHAFLGIPEVRQVEALIREALGPEVS